MRKSSTNKICVIAIFDYWKVFRVFRKDLTRNMSERLSQFHSSIFFVKFPWMVKSSRFHQFHPRKNLAG